PRLRSVRSASLPERKIECGQQRARFLVGARRGADRDVHAPDLGRLVVVDLRKDDVLLEAERVVAPAVEALRVEPAEVAHARRRDVDQAVEELVHARLAQRDLAADRLVFAQLVGRDRLARHGDHRLLAGDHAEVSGGRLHLLAVVDALADAHVEDDLLDPGPLHAVLVAELLGHRLAYVLVVMAAHARRPARGRRLRLALGGRLVAALVGAFALGRGLAGLGVALGSRRVAAGSGRRRLLALRRLRGLVVL